MGTNGVFSLPPPHHTHTHRKMNTANSNKKQNNTKKRGLEMRALNEDFGFTGHEKFILPDLYMKL